MTKRIKVAYAVSREIVASIASEKLKPGTILDSEAEMIERFGVSRASLRESLRILELLGLVQMKPGPGGGPIVVDVDSKAFGDIASLYYQMMGATYRDLLDARLTFEPLVVRLAATRRDEKSLAAIAQHLKSAAAVDLADDAQFRTVGQEFHALLASVSGNPIIDLLVCSCIDVFAGRVSGYLYPQRSRGRVIRAHHAIAEAVIDGDANRAEQLMREHMDHYVRQASSRYTGILAEVVSW